MYFAQFFALEMFFRGFWLGVLRKSFGSGAIFAMAVPYCMIHYGKPYLEAIGAIVAGIALGSLVDEDEEHLPGLPRPHHGGGADGLALAQPPPLHAAHVVGAGEGGDVHGAGRPARCARVADRAGRDRRVRRACWRSRSSSWSAIAEKKPRGSESRPHPQRAMPPRSWTSAKPARRSMPAALAERMPLAQ